MTNRTLGRIATMVAMAAFALAAAPVRAQASAAADLRPGDYIVAIVNSELVTAGEVQLRIVRVKQEAARNRQRLPPDEELRKQLVDALIDERVLTTYARESGVRVDNSEVDRAIANIAAQNQMTLAQLRDRLRVEGVDYARFRDNLRDQIAVDRVREREVLGRIQVTDLEIDNLLDKQRAAAGVSSQYNIAQILVTVPEGASESEIAARRARAETALARVNGGEPFPQVAREMSEDSNRANGGEIGMRPAERLPDAFVEVVRPLDPGAVSPTLLRTGAGFHVIKLVDRRDAGNFSITQTRARHVLLRASPQVSQQASLARLAALRSQIQAGTLSFEQAARDNSEDGSAAQGGDLGWVSPGAFVPEFEAAMNPLPIGGLSEPFVTRFGAHLVQVLDRRSVTLDAKQQREQARNVLREQRFEEAYNEWARELRARSYVEMREAPY
ncbi:MAG TPA: peptidylprolyl isomerase [Burkholderiaceae bacterium]|nr:peptidylprolyl isomerase [Burkholderiaceae bacterium]